jgi:multicomponent Na+:H+ antiporter subunit E
VIGKFILLFLVWIGISNSLAPDELIVGAIVSFIVVYFFTDRSKLNLFSILKKYIFFIPLFLKELVKSNLEVAKIVLSPKIDIKSGIVDLQTTLINDSDKLLLANSITLTPGTLTLELDGDHLYVHVLDIKEDEKEYLQEKIVGKFEKVIDAK